MLLIPFRISWPLLTFLELFTVLWPLVTSVDLCFPAAELPWTSSFSPTTRTSWTVSISNIFTIHLLSSLKGQCHEMDIFWEGLTKHLHQYFLCMRWWFSRSFKGFLPPYTFYLLLLNYLLIYTMLIETLLRIPFSAFGKCSLVPTSRWLQETAHELNFHRRLHMIL